MLWEVPRSMTSTEPSVLDSRYDHRFPKLDAVEIERLLRFGEVSCFAAGEAMAESGKVGPGLIVILAGEVEVTRRDQLGHRERIVSYGPGSFLGELAQLAGRPSLVDAEAMTQVRALILSPERLRALLVGEAEIGERIMRALILRRVGLIETGAGGPIIIGRADNADVLRLEGFLSRNGHPFQQLDPAVDPEAKTLIDRFHLDAAQLPIVLCPNGKFAALAQRGRACPLPRTGQDHRSRPPLRPHRRRRRTGRPRHRRLCRLGGPVGARARLPRLWRPGRRLGTDRELSRLSDRHQRHGVDGAGPTTRPRNSASRWPFPTRWQGSKAAPAGASHWILRLINGESAKARAVVIASGARYRRLAVDNLADFEGSSVHYWASPLEARLCAGQEVALVGGGNSAGQAAVYLSGRASKVWVLVRGPSLEVAMSRYLIDRISGLANVEVVTRAPRSPRLEGSNGLLETVTLAAATAPK